MIHIEAAGLATIVIMAVWLELRPLWRKKRRTIVGVSAALWLTAASIAMLMMYHQPVPNPIAVILHLLEPASDSLARLMGSGP